MATKIFEEVIPINDKEQWTISLTYYANEEINNGCYYEKVRAYRGSCVKERLEHHNGYVIKSYTAYGSNDGFSTILKVLDKSERKSKKLDAEMWDLLKHYANKYIESVKR